MLDAPTFSFRTGQNDQANIDYIALRLNRKPSDAVRVVLSQVAKALQEQEQKDPEPAEQVPAN
jgi:hypothetical protein